MAFDQYTVGEAIVLTPRKNLVGGNETNELLAAIDRAVVTGPAKIVLDLGEIKWVSSLGVGLLRKASITCQRSGGWLRLARLAKIVENTLLVTGLIIFFDTYETVDEAAIAPLREAHRWPSRTPPGDRPERPKA